MMEMTEKEATKFFAEFYNGEHHFPDKIKPFGLGWSIAHYGELASFDFDQMTTLVLMAHRDCVRVSVMRGKKPNTVQIALHKRAGRCGRMSERHPSIENIIAPDAAAELDRLKVVNAELLEACKAVLATIERADLGGKCLWIEPPYQASAVHETATERLQAAIANAQT